MLAKISALLIVFLFSLWDFYFAGGNFRPFDIIGLYITLLVTVVLTAGKVKNSVNLSCTIEIWTILLIWLYMGAILGALLPGNRDTLYLAFIVGPMLAFYAANIPVKSEYLLKAIEITLCIHIAFFITLYAIYYSTGTLIDVHQFFGKSVKGVTNSTARLGGLFREPSNYSFSMFALFMLRKQFSSEKKLDAIDFLCLLTMSASLSLLGIATVMALLCYFGNMRTRITGISIIIIAFIALSSLDVFASSMDVFWRRIDGIDEDDSSAGRYGPLIDYLRNCSFEWEDWVGHGVTWDFLIIGSNGHSVVLYSYGFLGTLGIGVLFILLMEKKSRARNLMTIAWAGLFAPMWGMIFWWGFLGLLCRRNSDCERLPISDKSRWVVRNANEKN